MTASAPPQQNCVYCGLPIPQPWRTRRRPVTSTPPEEPYCCFGCRFAAAVTQARGEKGEANWALTRLGLAIFFTMNVVVFTMVLWTQDVYGEDPASKPLVDSLHGLFRYLSLLFALPVLFLLGGPLLDNSWRCLRQGRLTTDWLLLAGVAAAYLYSAISVFRDEGQVYFEVGCVVLLLVTLGRWLEATGKIQASEAIESLQKLLPDRVRLVADGGEKEVPLKQIAVGDRVRVLAGERIPCDGKVERHAATVDEQILTGESGAVVKEPGDPVHAGTLNLDSDLYLEASAPGGEGALTRLIQLVRQAREAKSRFEHLADRIAAWFLPAAALIALGAGAYHAQHSGLMEGVLAGLAVLLIACPCALGLATPLAVWNALGEAAQAHVLFRNGEALERLAGIRAVRFDKTGTLTTGTPIIAEFAAADAERDEALLLAGRLASSSQHGYSVAIRRFVEEACNFSNNLELVGQPSRLSRTGETPVPPSYGFSAQQDPIPDTRYPIPDTRYPIPDTRSCEVRTFPGRGILAKGTEDVYLGSARWMEESRLTLQEPLASVVRKAVAEEHPLVCLGWAGQVRGVFVLQEQMRSEAKEALAQLRQHGIDVRILSGDHKTRAAALERALDIPVEAELLPEDKTARVAQARQMFGPVAMVGDGINDAPALACSDVGIAMGCGADVARDSATVCLLSNDLLRLPWAIALARRTVRVIRMNLFWSFAYNVVGIGLACTGALNPVLASLAMVFSSFLVVTNSIKRGA